MRRPTAIDDIAKPSVKVENVPGVLCAEHGMRMALRLHRDPITWLDSLVEEVQADLKPRATAGDQRRVAIDVDDLARHGQTHGIALA
jgi:hypothetical protein